MQAVNAPHRRGEGGAGAKAYELAATGHTDWEVASATGLAKTHVGEIVTNPIYAGRLRRGESAGVDAIVDPALWSKVQEMRERRRTRAPGRIVKRSYALRLRCAGCGRFLYGDVGRYRHPSPTCEAFLAATPLVRRRYRVGRDRRVQGHSYPQAWYEDAIGDLLAELGSLDDPTITEVVSRYRAEPSAVDRATLVRIVREREEAGRVLAKTRDVLAWQTAMARLDADEQAAHDAIRPEQLSPGEVVAYLRSLPALWSDSDLRDGRRSRPRCSRAPTSAGSSSWSTNSHPTRSNWASEMRFRPCSRSPHAGQVSLVEARGVAPS